MIVFLSNPHTGTLGFMRSFSSFCGFIYCFVLKNIAQIQAIYIIDDFTDEIRTYDPRAVVCRILTIMMLVRLSLKGIKIYIVAGNHDLAMNSKLKNTLNELAQENENLEIIWPTAQEVTVRGWDGERKKMTLPVSRIVRDIYGKKVLISAGHEFDPWARFQKRWNRIYKLTNYLEKIFGVNSNTKLFKFLRKIRRYLHWTLYKVHEKEFYGVNELVDMGAHDLLFLDQPDIHAVVLGQTHKRKYEVYGCGKIYVNAGNCINGQLDVTIWHPNGQIQHLNW